MKNKKQSMVNPYSGRKMNMNIYSGKELMGYNGTGNTGRYEHLATDEYYDEWEDDRLYSDPEVDKYE